MNELKNRKIAGYVTATEYQELREWAESNRMSVSSAVGFLISKSLVGTIPPVAGYAVELARRLGFGEAPSEDTDG